MITHANLNVNHNPLCSQNDCIAVIASFEEFQRQVALNKNVDIRILLHMRMHERSELMRQADGVQTTGKQAAIAITITC